MLYPFNKKLYAQLNKQKHFEERYYAVNHLYEHFKTQFAPGHFYSPYPNLDEIKTREKEIFNRKKRPIAGIDIQERQQLDLLKNLGQYYKQLPYSLKKNKDLRYFFGMHAYSYTDATVLFCMLMKYRPRRVLEIGSGYSSALMLDVKERFLPEMELTFVEPYPDLLVSLTKSGDDKSYHLLDKPLHEIKPAVFQQLQAGDVLFIDSTHVSKAGSDVNQIYFEILPHLKKGVIIHIHDVFYPFEYPIEWVEETRAWNEDYLLRAFLYNNTSFKILFFNHFLNIHHQNTIGKTLPFTKKNAGGSIWLKKTD